MELQNLGDRRIIRKTFSSLSRCRLSFDGGIASLLSETHDSSNRMRWRVSNIPTGNAGRSESAWFGYQSSSQSWSQARGRTNTRVDYSAYVERSKQASSTKPVGSFSPTPLNQASYERGHKSALVPTRGDTN